MTDFKVGDKVKILNGRNLALYTKGMVGVVIDDRYRNLVDPYYRVRLMNGETWNYKKEEVKLIKEKKEFKMGELVTVLKSNHGAPEETIGRRGIIRNATGVPRYCVEFSHRKSPFAFHTEQWWYSEDELELALPVSSITSHNPQNKEETTMTKEIKEGQRVIHEGCGTYIDASEGLLVDRIEADGTTRVESIATGEKEWVITEYLRSAEIEVGEFVEVLKDHRIFRVGDVCEVIEVDEKDPTGFNYLVEKEDSTRWIYKDEVRLASLWYEVEREENIGSENGTLIVEQNIKTKELRITRGCFKKKTLDEFEEAVKRKPEGDPHRAVYEFLIRKYKEKYPQPVEKKYYVKLSEGMVEQLNGVSGLYLNFQGSMEEHVFASKEEVGTYKTQFTQTEAEGWVEKLDKLELEIIEVKEEEK